MRKILTMALAFCLISTTSLMACHSNYFDECFTKFKQMHKAGKLDKHQIASIREFGKQFNAAKSLDHKHGKGCSAHASHEPAFVAAAAGVLNDEQFKTMTGKVKTENQKLRFEINELKRELAELKELVKQLQAK